MAGVKDLSRLHDGGKGWTKIEFSDPILIDSILKSLNNGFVVALAENGMMKLIVQLDSGDLYSKEYHHILEFEKDLRILVFNLCYQYRRQFRF